jgi:hypothetical protein
MAVDMIARMMAMEKGGGTTDAYTKAETDELLAEKADKATTYTKTEVDTAFSGKQDSLTTAQLSAVNSGITADRLSQDENNILLNWETGRNIIDYTSADIQKVNGSNLTITVAPNKKMMINGTQSTSASAGIGIPFLLPAGTWYVSGCPSGGGYNTYRVDLRYVVGETQFVDEADTGNGFFVTANADISLIYNIRIAPGYACNNLIISPMIISKAVYDAGGTNYQPYAMSNVELTAAIQALQAQLANQ